MSTYSDASLILPIAPTYKAGKIYSLKPTDGSGDFTLSRASAATRVNSEGLIELVSTNVPRFNYSLIDGVVQNCPSLLLEPQRTNLETKSKDIDNWLSSNTTEVANYAISPDGSQSATKVSQTTANAEHSVYDSLTVDGSSEYTQSVFLKMGDGSTKWRYIQFKFRNGGFTTGGGGGGVVVDLQNGTITHNQGLNGYGIEKYPNGWFRVYISQNSTDVYSYAGPLIAFNEIASGYDVNFVGDINASVFVWGSQFELSSFPTSYIPTSGATATRLVDNLLGQLTTGVFNDDEGTLFLHFKAFEDDTSYRYLAISDGTTSNRVVITLDNTYRIQSAVSLAGVTQSNVIKQMTNDSLSSGVKVAMTYKNNEFKSFVNGVETTPRDTSGSVFPTGTLKYLRFTQGNTTSGPLNGETKQVQYFPTALNDTDLETLTSWDSFSDMAIGQLYTIE